MRYGSILAASNQMIHDCSAPLSTLPARVVKLTEALNQKKYLDAQVLATDISINMSEVTLWIGRELKGELK